MHIVLTTPHLTQQLTWFSIVNNQNSTFRSKILTLKKKFSKSKNAHKLTNIFNRTHIFPTIKDLNFPTKIKKFLWKSKNTQNSPKISNKLSTKKLKRTLYKHTWATTAAMDMPRGRARTPISPGLARPGPVNNLGFRRLPKSLIPLFCVKKCEYDAVEQSPLVFVDDDDDDEACECESA